MRDHARKGVEFHPGNASQKKDKNREKKGELHG